VALLDAMSVAALSRLLAEERGRAVPSQVNPPIDKNYAKFILAIHCGIDRLPIHAISN